MVVNLQCMAPDIFPAGFFDNDFDEIVSLLKTDQDRNTMRGYQSTINAGAHRPKLVSELKYHLSQMDARRGTDWKPLFPWLYNNG